MGHQFGFMGIISIFVLHCDLQSDVLLIAQRDHWNAILSECPIKSYHTIIRQQTQVMLIHMSIYVYAQRQWREHILVGLSVAESVLQV